MIRLSAVASRPSPAQKLPLKDGTATLRALDSLLDESGRRSRFPGWLEARFEKDTGSKQSTALFRSIVRTIAVYNAFLLGDLFLLPSTLSFAIVLHLGVVTPAMLIVLSRLRQNPSRHWRDILAATPSILMIAQIITVYLCSRSPDSPHYLYFVFMTAICSNTSIPLSYRAARTISAASCVLLAFTLIVACRVPLGIAAMQFISLGACVYVTLRTNEERNRELRRGYLLDLRNRLRVEAIGQEARHDALTGLANRRGLDEAAAEIWARGDARGSPVSIILFDVDRFKSFNDIYGHQTGDSCLKRIADCALVELGGMDDVAARYGGEEFMLLLPSTPLAEAVPFAERLRGRIVSLQIPHDGAEELGVATASFGVATGHISECSFEALTAAADAALYAAKRGGRNRVATRPLSPQSFRAQVA